MQDKLGQELEIGDEVIIAIGTRETRICKIKSFGKKMLVVDGGPSYQPTYNRYPIEVVKVGSARSTEAAATVPQNIAATINHSLRIANGTIRSANLEAATDWVNSLIWTKE